MIYSKQTFAVLLALVSFSNGMRRSRGRRRKGAQSGNSRNTGPKKRSPKWYFYSPFNPGKLNYLHDNHVLKVYENVVDSRRHLDFLYSNHRIKRCLMRDYPEFILPFAGEYSPYHNRDDRNHQWNLEMTFMVHNHEVFRDAVEESFLIAGKEKYSPECFKEIQELLAKAVIDVLNVRRTDLLWHGLTEPHDERYNQGTIFMMEIEDEKHRENEHREVTIAADRRAAYERLSYPRKWWWNIKEMNRKRKIKKNKKKREVRSGCCHCPCGPCYCNVGCGGGGGSSNRRAAMIGSTEAKYGRNWGPRTKAMFGRR